MEFVTIYSTPDASEISIIKNLFEEKGVDYKILDEVTSGVIAGAGVTGVRLQVREEDREKAKEILIESGFLGHRKSTSSSRRKPTVNKWILVFLAALVLVIVAILITWFMNVS
ncbi:DUF2007 domain-containing protein [Antarcticibacterium sp. 1MA-6-2]|uniref:putative signal transducing protein n=1 Tax=Antarcticibacterium sp. 1MA-6-2 TaxID=2908210 RepID=UPI001F48A537|nr:DUF2007 domain-containing protein [Antarcticibacterium sp. 1MA-6-2]UJH89938.1 DUF2007 domain-containing protein [Antarcticibacterium sp. 1MA-6-2]